MKFADKKSLVFIVYSTARDTKRESPLCSSASLPSLSPRSPPCKNHEPPPPLSSPPPPPPPPPLFRSDSHPNSGCWILSRTTSTTLEQEGVRSQEERGQECRHPSNLFAIGSAAIRVEQRNALKLEESQRSSRVLRLSPALADEEEEILQHAARAALLEGLPGSRCLQDIKRFRGARIDRRESVDRSNSPPPPPPPLPPSYLELIAQALTEDHLVSRFSFGSEGEEGKTQNHRYEGGEGRRRVIEAPNLQDLAELFQSFINCISVRGGEEGSSDRPLRMEDFNSAMLSSLIKARGPTRSTSVSSHLRRARQRLLQEVLESLTIVDVALSLQAMRSETMMRRGSSSN
eukprot:768572-Hanusia_phi.AAC.4